MTGTHTITSLGSQTFSPTTTASSALPGLLLADARYYRYRNLYSMRIHSSSPSFNPRASLWILQTGWTGKYHLPEMAPPIWESFEWDKNEDTVRKEWSLRRFQFTPHHAGGESRHRSESAPAAHWVTRVKSAAAGRSEMCVRGLMRSCFKS